MSIKPPLLAERMAGIAISPTIKGTMVADELRRAGVKVIDLGAGEPDFPTPRHIVAAAHAALDANFTKYTANPGVLELRQAIADRYRADYGLSIGPDQVIATAGGKQALSHASQVLFGPDDEIVTHTPGWPTIIEQIKIAGARPVIVRTSLEDGFAVRGAAIVGAFTPRTRAVVINSPGNPTGALLEEAEARLLAQEAARRDVWVVLDLCYERLVYDDVPHGLPSIFSEMMADRLVLAGSASKAWAMTGWRCGWLIAPAAVVRAANALQSHTTSNVNSIAQKAAIAALTGPQECVDDMLAEYKRRRDQVLAWLAEEPRLACAVPQGAFYVFPSIAAFLSPDGIRTSLEFSERLLAEEHVVTTPGEAFDAPGFLRLSYATSIDELREGVVRLLRFARRHARP